MLTEICMSQVKEACINVNWLQTNIGIMGPTSLHKVVAQSQTSVLYLIASRFNKSVDASTVQCTSKGNMHECQLKSAIYNNLSVAFHVVPSLARLTCPICVHWCAPNFA